jgi:adenylosuccinate synthase
MLGLFTMSIIAVVGTLWGDEGKGKIVDVLSEHSDVVVRAQGGNNAGHTIILGDNEFKLHIIPSGILHPHVFCYVAAGVVVDPEALVEEIKMLEKAGVNVRNRLSISERAHVIFPKHKEIDGQQEMERGAQALGTTKRGIGPAYADKITRTGVRMADYIISSDSEASKFLKPFIYDVERMIHYDMQNDMKILLEGAQGAFLDINMGTYPYVTSSCTLAAGLCAGAGIGPTDVDHVIGIVKAYATRVGTGPFPTEVPEEELFLDHTVSREFGATTGRRRKIGWFDAVLIKEAARLNGLRSLAITKIDVLDDLETIKICIGYDLRGRRVNCLPSRIEDCEEVVPVYEEWKGWKASTKNAKKLEDLPNNARIYLNRIEELVGVPIGIISCGPDREQTFFVDR